MDEEKPKKSILSPKARAILERVEARRARPVPETLTAELLLGTPDADLQQLVMDYICGKLRREGTKDFRGFAQRLPTGLRMVYITMCVEGDVCNGGFHQLFYNSSGELAQDAVECFNLIGCAPYGQLVARAIKQFAREKDMQTRIRQERSLETFFHSYAETKLGELDKEFYALRPSYPLKTLRTRYIRDHIDEFVTP
jgi:hypothetical protein